MEKDLDDIINLKNNKKTILDDIYNKISKSLKNIGIDDNKPSVIKNGSAEPTEDFYVCLDGLRLENVTSNNSVYGLTGYSVIKTPEAKTIIKSANTTNYIEFRFALDV